MGKPDVRTYGNCRDECCSSHRGPPRTQIMKVIMESSPTPCPQMHPTSLCCREAGIFDTEPDRAHPNGRPHQPPLDRQLPEAGEQQPCEPPMADLIADVREIVHIDIDYAGASQQSKEFQMRNRVCCSLGFDSGH